MLSTNLCWHISIVYPFEYNFHAHTCVVYLQYVHIYTEGNTFIIWMAKRNYNELRESARERKENYTHIHTHTQATTQYTQALLTIAKYDYIITAYFLFSVCLYLCLSIYLSVAQCIWCSGCWIVAVVIIQNCISPFIIVLSLVSAKFSIFGMA